ncbi:hypothetical protein [Methanocorpusculum labreanum]|nr:hypothetical protein [Methanocorpusculum labreanum]
MTETQNPEAQNANQAGASEQHSGTNASYGLYIALVGLIASLLIGCLMILVGMRTASDIVAVIGAFTSVTGTLTGYFFGQKIESANRENTENRISASMADLSLEKTKNTEITKKLYESENKSNLLIQHASNYENVIKIVKKKKLELDNKNKATRIENGDAENLLNEIMDLLDLPKMPEDV